jgi:hypothetical protein
VNSEFFRQRLQRAHIAPAETPSTICSTACPYQGLHVSIADADENNAAQTGFRTL